MPLDVADVVGTHLFSSFFAGVLRLPAPPALLLLLLALLRVLPRFLVLVLIVLTALTCIADDGFRGKLGADDLRHHGGADPLGRARVRGPGGGRGCRVVRRRR